MSMRKLLLSVAAASLMAGPAFADGGPVPEPPPAPPPEPAPEPAPAPEPEPAPPPPPAEFNWTGGYAGIQIGHLWGDAEHVFFNGAPTDHSNPDGFVAGVHAGFNYVTGYGGMLLGIEVDFDWTDAEGTFDNTTGATSSGSTEINYQGTARARLGWVADRTLVYFTGGLALADVEYGGGPAGGPCCGFDKTDYGWVLGGGIEYAFTDYLSGRIEYRYTDYGTETDALAPSFPGVDMAVDLSTHQGRVGLSWLF